MKKYLFSYLTMSNEKNFILAYGNNRYEARESIPFPCSYKGKTGMSDSQFIEIFSGTIFN